MSGVINRRTFLTASTGALLLGKVNNLPAGATTYPSEMIFGWGSSSMAGERSNEAGKINFLGTIADGLNRGYVNYARGGQTSLHTLVMRGAHHPRVHASPNAVPALRWQVPAYLRGVPFHHSLNLNGWFGGVYGRLSPGRKTFLFQRRYPTRRALALTYNSRFVSEAGLYAQPGRHILWMGKNDLIWNNLNRQTAISNTKHAYNWVGKEAANRNFVLGHWITRKDLLEAAKDVRWMNDALREWLPATHWLDVQALLTSEKGLRSTPVAHLNILNNPEWVKEMKNGRIPSVLTSTDGVHLNSHGYAVVAQAVIAKLKNLNW